MKKLFTIMLFLSILSLSACKNNHNIFLESQNYNIYSEGGTYSIYFKNLAPDGSTNSNHMDLVEYPRFYNIKDMFDTIKYGKITKENISRMGITQYDELEIINLDSPLDAQVPNNTLIDHITWYLDKYTFALKSDSFDYARMHCYNQAQYEECFNTNYTQYFDEDQTIHTTTTIDDRNATEILYSNSTGEYKLLRYEIVDKDRTLYIQERFILSHMNPNLFPYPLLDGIPTRIEIFGEENNTYFYAELYGFTERPSEEWLCSFGLTPLAE